MGSRHTKVQPRVVREEPHRQYSLVVAEEDDRAKRQWQVLKGRSACKPFCVRSRYIETGSYNTVVELALQRSPLLVKPLLLWCDRGSDLCTELGVDVLSYITRLLVDHLINEYIEGAFRLDWPWRKKMHSLGERSLFYVEIRPPQNPNPYGELIDASLEMRCPPSYLVNNGCAYKIPYCFWLPEYYFSYRCGCTGRDRIWRWVSYGDVPWSCSHAELGVTGHTVPECRHRDAFVYPSGFTNRIVPRYTQK